MRLTIHTMVSPLGDLLLVGDGEGRLHALEYADGEERLHRLLRRRLGREADLTPGALPQEQVLTRYFAGEIAAIDALPVAMGGTAFQNQAWAALREIPAGSPATYGGQARRIGHPTAARAVGSANHNNPINIVVPCHRIIGGNGALTGYAGGLERKRWLLDHEARHADPAAAQRLL
ncbi:methylated-DNA--[protein]-cysteine S-methyltransferase [Novosphingobium rosa]|uniref:methylated-DNA--[protein]-cysteine S-methyltransferase n=1 Tax=Novosphingobium rosa TaxID=76978 RepID=UPI000829A067|nr:methylated-DNA--[protein]-cysteine S-methyltransferase [Novosphingobium rosa]